MPFLGPYLLMAGLGALAAAIPIALHFFYRSRYRRVPWGAMKFLLTSIEQTSRRLRFQELLLLLLRVLLLIILALAIARPVTTVRGGSGSEAVDAVFIIDTSYSMGTREGAATRLEQAKAAALQVIDQLPPYSTVQVVRVTDRATLLGPRSPSNLDQARQLIRGLEIQHLSTDFLPGFDEAEVALQRGFSPNKEVYLLSDLQQRGWEAQAAALKAKVQDLGKKSTIYIVRCGQRTPRNAAIVGLTPAAGMPHTGERANFTVLIRNSGKEPIRDLNVSLTIDGRADLSDASAVPVVNPGDTLPITLTGKLEKPGLTIVTATLQHDDLEADNRFDRVIYVRDQARILVVDGAPNDREPEKSSSFFLLHSLRPVPENQWGQYHIQPRLVSARQAAPALLGDKELCILVNVALWQTGANDSEALSEEFVDRLAAFVKEGKSLIVVGGPRVNPAVYNLLLFDRHNLLPARLVKAYTVSANQPLHVDPATAAAQSFLGGFREAPLDRVRQVEVTGALDIDDSSVKEATTLLRYSNGRPAFLQKKVGEGEVLLITTSADLRWTDWPLRPTYLPMWHAALGALLQGPSHGHHQDAGQPLRWYPIGEAAGKLHELIRPDGTRVRLGFPETSGGRAVLSATDTEVAGIYRIGIVAGSDDLAADYGKAPFSVTPDIRESEDLTSLTDAQINGVLGFQPVHLSVDDQSQISSADHRSKREWTAWVLWAALILVLGETAFAWFCGRAW